MEHNTLQNDASPRLEKATAADADELLSLMEEQPANGALTLLYTRRPDPLQSYLTESDRSTVLVLRDEEGHIAYQGAVVVRDYYLNGSEHAVGYVTGVRKRASYKGTVNWMKLAAQDLHAFGCEGFLFSFLADNQKAERMITASRSYLPPVEKICTYSTVLLHPKAILRIRNTPLPGVTFRPMKEGEEGEVVRFLQEEGRRHDFFPVIRDLYADCPGLRREDCFVLALREEIVAFCALWHQESYKQIIIERYAPPYDRYRKFSFLTDFLGYIPFPEEHTMLSFPQIALFTARDDSLFYRRMMLQSVARSAHTAGERMLVIGCPAGSPVDRQLLKPLRSVRFDSTLYYMPASANASDSGSDADGTPASSAVSAPASAFHAPAPECAWL